MAMVFRSLMAYTCPCEHLIKSTRGPASYQAICSNKAHRQTPALKSLSKFRLAPVNSCIHGCIWGFRSDGKVCVDSTFC